MIKVCPLSPRANMTYRCQCDLEAHPDHTITSKYNWTVLCENQALLLWFFGDFRCGALLFVVIHVIYKYKNR